MTYLSYRKQVRVATMISLPHHQIRLYHIPDRPFGSIPVVALGPLSVVSVRSLDVVRSAGAVGIVHKGYAPLEPFQFERTNRAPQGFAEIIDHVPYERCMLGKSLLAGLARVEEREGPHREITDSPNHAVPSAERVNGILLRRAQMFRSGNKQEPRTPKFRCPSVQAVFTQTRTDASNRLQNPLCQEPRVVKDAKLMLRSGPHTAGKFSIDGSAVRDDNLWLNTQLFEMEQERQHTAFRRVLTQADRDRSVVQRIGSHKNHKAVIEFVQGQDAGESLDGPPLVIALQVNRVSGGVEPIIGSRECGPNVKVPVETLAQPGKGGLVLSDGATGLLNNAGAVVFPFLCHRRLQPEELFTGLTTIDTYRYSQGGSALKIKVFDSAFTNGVPLTHSFAVWALRTRGRKRVRFGVSFCQGGFSVLMPWGLLQASSRGCLLEAGGERENRTPIRATDSADPKSAPGTSQTLSAKKHSFLFLFFFQETVDNRFFLVPTIFLGAINQDFCLYFSRLQPFKYRMDRDKGIRGISTEVESHLLQLIPNLDSREPLLPIRFENLFNGCCQSLVLNLQRLKSGGKLFLFFGGHHVESRIQHPGQFLYFGFYTGLFLRKFRPSFPNVGEDFCVIYHYLCSLLSKENIRPNA